MGGMKPECELKMSDPFTSSPSTESSGGGEHLVEALMSQVDDDNIATIIRLQKKS